MDCRKIYNEVNRQPGFNVLKEPLHVLGNCFVEYYVWYYTKTNKIPFEFDGYYIIEANDENGPPSYILPRLIPIRIILLEMDYQDSRL